MKKFGYRKGSLSEAFDEAITLWIARETQSTNKLKNPTKQLRGILSGIKQSSVDLQHEGASLFVPEDR